MPPVGTIRGMSETVRVAIEVTAGVIPGQVDPELTRRYTLAEREWDAAKGRGGDGLGVVLAEVNGRATGYASLLMMQPDRVNWVRTDWIYF